MLTFHGFIASEALPGRLSKLLEVIVSFHDGTASSTRVQTVKDKVTDDISKYGLEPYDTAPGLRSVGVRAGAEARGVTANSPESVMLSLSHPHTA